MIERKDWRKGGRSIGKEEKKKGREGGREEGRREEVRAKLESVLMSQTRLMLPTLNFPTTSFSWPPTTRTSILLVLDSLPLIGTPRGPLENRIRSRYLNITVLPIGRIASELIQNSFALISITSCFQNLLLVMWGMWGSRQTYFSITKFSSTFNCQYVQALGCGNYVECIASSHLIIWPSHPTCSLVSKSSMLYAWEWPHHSLLPAWLWLSIPAVVGHLLMRIRVRVRSHSVI